MMVKHKYVVGDRVEVPKQQFLGNIITQDGVGVVTRLASSGDKYNPVMLIVDVDMQGERKYYPQSVRFIGGPEKKGD